MAYTISGKLASFCLLSASARKKLISTRRFTPLPLLLMGILSSPVIETFLKTSGHFRLAKSGDRKSTRLNSSHVRISYAVFCLKKKKTKRFKVVNNEKKN